VTGGVSASATIPLFPLHAVLFPGGALPLRIFEPRYLDMVSECLRNESGFGICLIREGEEIGIAAAPYEVGTFGRISYWQRRKDGLLGVTVTGERRYRMLEQEVGPDQLVTARIEFIDEREPLPLPDAYRHLSQLLERLFEQLGPPHSRLPRHYDEAGWVGSRLAELLPIPLAQKQYLLQEDDPLERLERLRAMLEAGNLL